jgi:hypothetical protein
MTKLTLAILLLLSTAAWAADPNPADYNITVHVSKSRMVFERDAATQLLNVIIAGKKYELRSVPLVNALLAPGDYKARLIRDEHETTYDSYQIYEFLFPDHKARNFTVVGQSE